MPRYVGLDVHKQFIEACFIDEQGKQLHRCRVAVTRESIQTFVAKCLQPSDHVVMETTTNTWEVADLILPQVAKVAIANPLKVKAIAESKIKTDKVDAGVLAQLLRCDFLPEVWIPDKTTRLLREMCAHRAGLAADQTRIKNRIQSLLAQRLIPVSVPVLFKCCSRMILAISSRLLILACDFGRLHMTQICLSPQVQTVLADLQFPRHLRLAFAAMDHHLHRLALEILPISSGHHTVLHGCAHLTLSSRVRQIGGGSILPKRPVQILGSSLTYHDRPPFGVLFFAAEVHR